MPFDSLPEHNPNIPQVVLDLIAARNYLDTHGWVKGTLMRGKKRCAIGALQQVVGLIDYHGLRTRNSYQMERRLAVATQLLECNLNPHNPAISIPTWNDTPTRTYTQVRDLFTKAINNQLADVKIG